MNKRYKIVWTKSASSDLETIIRYIAKNNPENAKTLFLKIKQEIAALSHSPKIGRYIPELQEQGILLYRELIINPWRLIYKIGDKSVYIMAVIDSRRNVEDILFEKLIRMKI